MVRTQGFMKEESMSDEQQQSQEDEVEAHRKRPVFDEPTTEGEDDNEVEAHRKRARHRLNIRMD
jgi:hypothetical protein